MSIGSGGDNTKLYLGSGNQLYYPSGAMSINSFRAYFQLNDGLTAGDLPTHAVRMFFGDDDATGVVDGRRKMEEGRSDAWYDLSGSKLSKKPTAKGIYIYKGKKVAIK